MPGIGRACTAASFAILLIALTPACAPRVTGPQRLVFVPPAPQRAGGKPAAERPGRPPSPPPLVVSSPDSANVRPAPAVLVHLRLVEGAERRRLVREALGRDFDPFDPGAAHGASFATIVMEVSNDGSDPLVFNPQNILLVTDRPDYLPPLDATRAYEAFRSSGLEVDPFMEDMHRLIYDTAVTVRQGESISRILAYRTPHPGVRKAMLSFSFFEQGRASMSFDVPMAQVADPTRAGAGDPAPGGSR